MSKWLEEVKENRRPLCSCGECDESKVEFIQSEWLDRLIAIAEWSEWIEQPDGSRLCIYCGAEIPPCDDTGGHYDDCIFSDEWEGE